MLIGGTVSTPPASLRLRSTLNPQNAVSQSSQAAFPSPVPRQPASYSITDDDLKSRGFLFRRTAEGLNLDQLNSVFVAVGFPRRDTAKIEVALQHTDAMLWVEYEKTQRPVAFARATGDGVFNAIIWDVVVDPSFQNLGLGKAVMERLVEDLQRKGICNIALYSEPRVLGFYRPLGFVSDPDGIRGMVFIRKQKNRK
ncbi:unnamed protein product [Microthlaspi erraticum]|uniref:histone acetyltransferase n=1 Tax=Microthlaspi erraticum TaxID=1685480 RepID=A0A6D2JBB0_9BRAS|nr:unnamed protein product [Microthlaspi erraticum]